VDQITGDQPPMKETKRNGFTMDKLEAEVPEVGWWVWHSGLWSPGMEGVRKASTRS